MTRRQRIVPFKFTHLRRRFGDRPFRMLDIGAGNHSATLARACFPAVRYSGVDRQRGYNNDDSDFAAMDEFFELDLTTLDFGAIRDGAYDVVMLAHVIEHLPNGDDVLRALVPKVAPGGVMYVEFPGPRSLHLPSMKGTLNFHDDETHVRLFTAAEVASVLRDAGLRIQRSGERRDWRGIVLLPLKVAHAWWRFRFIPGSAFWDVTGFAEFVLAERTD